MDDPVGAVTYQGYQLVKTGPKSTVYTLTSLQWCLGEFEQVYGRAPHVYLRHPETTFDGPFADLFQDDPRLAVGVVLLGPVEVEEETA